MKMKFDFQQPTLAAAVVALGMALAGGSAMAQTACSAGTGGLSLRCGDLATAAGIAATAVGRDAEASGLRSTALGEGSDATMTDATALGQLTDATGAESTAVGQGARATGTQSTALGEDADAFAGQSTALGNNARATVASATAVGAGSRAVSTVATALGQNAQASAGLTTAVGQNAQATVVNSSAYGQNARATAVGTTALGQASLANQANATALGRNAVASAAQGTAVGQGSRATANFATAIGQVALATHASATAIGRGAATTRTNQMVFGIAGNSYTAPGITSAASLAAQSGTVFFVTSDSAGNLATGSIATSALDGGGPTAVATGGGAASNVTSANIADGAVTSEELADGAVTAAKLGLANTAYVAADGATTLDNCDALITTLAETTGPALVVLGPGSYDCGEWQVVVPDGVHLRGSGRRVTTISGSLDNDLEGVVALGNLSALSDLGVHHEGGTAAAIAVSVPATSKGVEITDVRLSGGAESAQPFAMLVDGGEVLVRASILKGGVGNHGRANIVNSQLALSGATGLGAYRCVGAYDGTFSPLSSDCG